MVQIPHYFNSNKNPILRCGCGGALAQGVHGRRISSKRLNFGCGFSNRVAKFQFKVLGSANCGQIVLPIRDGENLHVRRELKHGSVYLGVESGLRAGKQCRKDVNGGWRKGLSYGGCIPAVLGALDAIEDLDEALKPWKVTLNRKEISIILKEQTKWERAVEIFEWLKAQGCYEINVIHYNIMFRILGRGRRWKHAQLLWLEMERKKIVPVNATYGTLIDAYSKAGLRDEALIWLDYMRNQGLKPDEVTMGTVLHTLKKAGEYDKVETYFKCWSSERHDSCCSNVNMVNEGKDRHCQEKSRADVSSVTSRRVHNSYTYSTLIDTYGKAGKLQKASDAFHQMLRSEVVPCSVTFNTMINIYCKHGLVQEAEGVIKKMEEIGCFPVTRTYNILISLHLKNDNIHLASSYFTKMKASGLMPDQVSYRILLKAYAAKGAVEEVEALLAEMDEEGVSIDEIIQTSLTRMYVKLGMLDRSWAWFQRFHCTGEMSAKCYAASIYAYGANGYLLEAEKAFSCCLASKKLSVEVFNVMIKTYGIVELYEKACEIVDIMDTYGIRQDKITCNSLIQILVGAELPHQATNYITKMQESGAVEDCMPYCAIIAAFAKLGELDKAEELYHNMVAFGVKPDVVVFGVFIDAFAECGNLHQATKYYEFMRSAGISGNQIIYSSLIKLFSKLGCLQKAQDTYKLLQQTENSPDVFASNCMIDLYSEYSMVDDAENIFGELKRKEMANEFSYAMMLCLYKKIGRFSEAIAVAVEMRKLGLLTATLSYNNVIRVYALSGKLREAVETFHHMMNSGIHPDDGTMKSLRLILMEMGISKGAINALEKKREENMLHSLNSWLATLCSLVGMHDEAQLCFSKPRSNSGATGIPQEAESCAPCT